MTEIEENQLLPDCKFTTAGLKYSYGQKIQRATEAHHFRMLFRNIWNEELKKCLQEEIIARCNVIVASTTCSFTKKAIADFLFDYDLD